MSNENKRDAKKYSMYVANIATYTSYPMASLSLGHVFKQMTVVQGFLYRTALNVSFLFQFISAPSMPGENLLCICFLPFLFHALHAVQSFSILGKTRRNPRAARELSGNPSALKHQHV